MAGNVKEWCSNETGHSRFLLGGAWNEPVTCLPTTMPRVRSSGRRVTASASRSTPAAAGLPWPRLYGSRRSTATLEAKPVGDDIFAVYRRQYAYDRTPLNAVVEATEEAESLAEADRRIRRGVWRGTHARASLPAEERIAAVPDGRLFPAADAFQLRSSRDMSLARWTSSSGADEPFCTRCTRGRTSGRRLERDGTERGTRAPHRVVERSRSRHRLPRNARGHRSDRLAYYGVSAGAEAGRDLDRSRTALEDQRAPGDRAGEAWRRKSIC